MVRKARAGTTKRGFTQSFELVLTLKDIDITKQELSISEAVFLPNRLSKLPRVCVFASGDLAVRARKAGADRVVEPEELDRLAAGKREAKKLAKAFTFFLAESTLMPRIGRALGPFLGPRGRMPMPLPPNASVEAMIDRLRQTVRVRGRGQLAVGARIGDEGMADDKVAENALAVINALEKRLPAGAKNVRSVQVKLSMGGPAKLVVAEAR